MTTDLDRVADILGQSRVDRKRPLIDIVDEIGVELTHALGLFQLLIGRHEVEALDRECVFIEQLRIRGSVLGSEYLRRNRQGYSMSGRVSAVCQIKIPITMCIEFERESIESVVVGYAGFEKSDFGRMNFQLLLRELMQQRPRKVVKDATDVEIDEVQVSREFSRLVGAQWL
jgi:hypothetical protein